jgi:hypothetical protein
MVLELLAFVGAALLVFWGLAYVSALAALRGPGILRRVLSQTWGRAYGAYDALTDSRPVVQRVVYVAVWGLAGLLIVHSLLGTQYQPGNLLTGAGLTLGVLLGLAGCGLYYQLIQMRRNAALWWHAKDRSIAGADAHLTANYSIRPRRSTWFFSLSYFWLLCLVILLGSLLPVSAVAGLARELGGVLEAGLGTISSGPRAWGEWYASLAPVEETCFWYLASIGGAMSLCMVLAIALAYHWYVPLPEETEKAALPHAGR